MMKKGGTGGGRTITGLKFESRITLEKAISSLPGYTVKDDKVYFKGEKIAEFYQKHKLLISMQPFHQEVLHHFGIIKVKNLINLIKKTS